MSAWLPTGTLKDGTLLFGPLNDEPTPNLGQFLEGEFKGRKWFVCYSGEPLSSEKIVEVNQWAAEMISSQSQ